MFCRRSSLKFGAVTELGEGAADIPIGYLGTVESKDNGSRPVGGCALHKSASVQCAAAVLITQLILLGPHAYLPTEAARYLTPFV